MVHTGTELPIHWSTMRADSSVEVGQPAEGLASPPPVRADPQASEEVRPSPEVAPPVVSYLEHLEPAHREAGVLEVPPASVPVDPPASET